MKIIFLEGENPPSHCTFEVMSVHKQLLGLRKEIENKREGVADCACVWGAGECGV